MNNQRIINASFDCVGQFKSTSQPLRNVAKDIITQRKLNSTERKKFLDIVFKWSRHENLIDAYFKEEVKFFSSMPSKQQDHLAVLVLAHGELDNLPLNPQVRPLIEGYPKWLKSLGDEQWLLRLGVTVGSKIAKDHGKLAAKIAQSLFKKPANYLAIDRTKLSKDKVVSILNCLGVKSSFNEAVPSAIKVDEKFYLGDLPEQVRRDVWVMDAGSQFISELIKPKASERVLDMCTGEGGKAKLISANPCRYFAMDIEQSRLEKAKARLQGKHVTFVCADGTNPPFEDESFDWVLLDAPCSGLGVARRHPDIIQRTTDATLKRLNILQHSLLKSAIKLVKPRGRILYATCSLLKSENEQQIERAIKENSRIKPLPLRELVDEHVKFLPSELDKFELTLFPHIHDCDGFYLAALEKTAE